MAIEISTMGPTSQRVGRCIYCRALEYGDPADPNARLSDEHIVPLALNGPWLLTEACCYSCQVEINRFEQPLLRTHFLPVRLHMPLRSRKKSGRRDVLPIYGDTQADLHHVPLGEHPVPLFMPILSRPNILRATDKPYANNMRGLWVAHLNMGRMRPGATAALDVFGMFRLLAKIGHGMAVSVVGLDFYPLLVPMILGRDIDRRCLFIGGPSRSFARDDGGLHRCDLITLNRDGRSYLVSRIQLFSQFGAPIYYVVVGTNDPDYRPPPLHPTDVR